MAKLCLVSFVIMCFIEVTLGSESTVLQQQQQVKVRETRDVKKESIALRALIDEKVSDAVNNALGRMQSTMNHLKQSGHLRKTEIRRLTREMKKLKSERESSEAALSTEIKELKNEMEQLKKSRFKKSGLKKSGLRKQKIQCCDRVMIGFKQVGKRMDTMETRMNDTLDRLTRVEVEGNVTELTRVEVDCNVTKLTPLVGQNETDATSTRTTITPTTPPRNNFQRILIAEQMSFKTSYLRQMIISSNQVTRYSFLNTSKILALVYDPTGNTVIFSRFSPRGIYSSPLDRGSSVHILRRGIKSNGLAVDDGVLFMTTFYPRSTVSRMGTDGTDWRTIRDLSGTGGSPRGIALDRKRQVIYIGNREKLLSVTYEGRHLTTLHTKSSNNWMYGVTLDDVRGLLYFSHGSNIMRRSLSGGDRDTVGEIDKTILNLIYYDNTIYVSSTWNGNIHALDSNNYTVTKLYTGDKSSVICLVP